MHNNIKIQGVLHDKRSDEVMFLKKDTEEYMLKCDVFNRWCLKRTLYIFVFLPPSRSLSVVKYLNKSTSADAIEFTHMPKRVFEGQGCGRSLENQQPRQKPKGNKSVWVFLLWSISRAGLVHIIILWREILIIIRVLSLQTDSEKMPWGNCLYANSSTGAHLTHNTKHTRIHTHVGHWKAFIINQAQLILPLCMEKYIAHATDYEYKLTLFI